MGRKFSLYSFSFLLNSKYKWIKLKLKRNMYAPKFELLELSTYFPVVSFHWYRLCFMMIFHKVDEWSKCTCERYRHDLGVSITTDRIQNGDIIRSLHGHLARYLVVIQSVLLNELSFHHLRIRHFSIEYL